MKDSKKTKNYSIIVLSDATACSRTFSLSSQFIHRAIIGSSILLLGFGFILFHYLSITIDKQRMHHSIKENETNKKTITELNSTIGTLNEKLKKIDELKERILVITYMKSPLAMKEIGIGGPTNEDMAMEQTNPIPLLPDNVTPSTTNPSRQVLLNPKQILKQAETIEKTFNEVLSAIDQRKLILSCTPCISPTHGLISSPFGHRTHPITNAPDFHAALDIATQSGNPIISPADGTVLVAETRGTLGRTIILDHNPTGYMTTYGHLSRFNVHEGQKVKRFEIIGYVGTTGMSNGPHLHYEIHYNGKRLNPYYWIIDKKTLALTGN